MRTTDGDSHDHVIDTGKGQFLLEQLGPLLPGMAEIMPLIGDRVWRCYYAGKARNVPLARFQLKEAVNLLHKGAFLRPKYADSVEQFCAEDVAPVQKAIEVEDWDEFERAFQSMVAAANAYHDAFDKRFLHWKMPEAPPPDLDLDAR